MKPLRIAWRLVASDILLVLIVVFERLVDLFAGLSWPDLDALAMKVGMRTGPKGTIADYNRAQIRSAHWGGPHGSLPTTFPFQTLSGTNMPKRVFSFKDNIKAAARYLQGRGFNINSGWRSHEDQMRLYRRWSMDLDNFVFLQNLDGVFDEAPIDLMAPTPSDEAMDALAWYERNVIRLPETRAIRLSLKFHDYASAALEAVQRDIEKAIKGGESVALVKGVQNVKVIDR